MMYAKLVVKNVKRSVKDYLVYIVTMTICVMLFYAFLSISSEYYQPDIGAQYDFTLLSDGMKLAICAVTLLLLFLIRYVNHYMLWRRQKEFAVQTVMGMEQRTVGWLFFAETLAMGALSMVFGIFLGMVCSQFITAMLLSDYGQSYQFTWMLFPDTVLLTICFFVCSFLLVGFFNIRTIRKIKIIDMLAAERQNEPHPGKSRFMPVITVLYLLMLAWMLVTGIRIKYFYFDARFALPVHLLFWGIVLAPASGLLWPIIWLVKRRNFGFEKLIAVEMIFTLLNSACAAGVPAMRGKYLLSYGAGVMNQYMLFLIVNVIYLICGIIFFFDCACLFSKRNTDITSNIEKA